MTDNNNSVNFEKVDSIPSKRGAKYQRLHDELTQMPGQWVRLEKSYKRATDAGSVVSHLKTNYGLEATARTAEGKVYHVYARFAGEAIT